MTDYIKRSDLMAFPIRRDHCDKKNANEHFIMGIESVLEYAENLPSSDVVEVVHSDWDTSGRYMFADGRVAVRCKNCGCTITAKEYNQYVWNYCPVCGAKMDGERKENE